MEALEQQIDRLQAALEPLKAFILPGGAAAAAQLHVARTVCRRAERALVRLSDGEPEAIDPQALKFLNRLSDLLFAAARYANRDRGDVLWRSETSTPSGRRSTRAWRAGTPAASRAGGR